MTFDVNKFNHDPKRNLYTQEASTLGINAPDEEVSLQDPVSKVSRVFRGRHRDVRPGGDTLGWRFHEVNGDARLLIIND